MKRKMVLGVALLVLFTLQAQDVFANDRQNRNLLDAGRSGDIAGARRALQRGANINASRFFYDGSRSALSLAVINGHHEMVRFLVGQGANINFNAGSPLILAIRRDRFDMVRLLVELGANINIVSDFGVSPLRDAVSQNNFEIIRFLVEQGVNLRSECGRVALRTATAAGQFRTVQLLVENGVNINARGPGDGRSALNVAFDRGEMEIHAFLLAHGAIEFEAIAQPAAPPPVAHTPAPAPAPAPAAAPARTVADTVAQAFQSPLDNGRYRMSGRTEEISFAGIARTGMVNFRDAAGTIHRGTYSIDGNRLTINVMGRTFFYTINSRTSFSGHGEVWHRVGL